MNASNRARIALFLAVVVVVVTGGLGVAVAVEWHRRSADDRPKAASCLRPIAAAAVLYANAGGATQPATGPATQPAADAERLWAQLHDGGQVILMRHAATTPGTGDPPGFKLGDCSTQRNLSDAGRAQAKAVGDEVRRREVPVGRVLSSQYCRALDTARLAFGKAEEEPALNLAFADEDKR